MLPEPYYETENGKLYHGDCLDIMREMKSDSVQCCVTSPPYWGLRDYGTEPQVWPAVEYSPLAGLAPIKIKEMTCCLGLEPTPEDYIGHMVLVLRGTYRILRPDGTLWLNMGDSYAGSGKGRDADGIWNPGQGGSKQATNKGSTIGPLMFDFGRQGKTSTVSKVNRGRATGNHTLKPKDLCMIPARLALALQADGWYVRCDIIWAKPNPMPESATDRPTKAHEYVFLMSKQPKYYYDAEAIRESHFGTGHMDYSKRYKHNAPKKRGDGQGHGYKECCVNSAGRNRRSVWTIATQPFPEAHFATFPEKLVIPCILAGTSEKGNCSVCGKPWGRIIESKKSFESGSGKSGNPIYGKNGERCQGGGDTGDIRKGPVIKTKTIGWQPSCSCNADTVKPIVLDPFGGAATVAKVCEKHGRGWVICELSKEYCDISVARIKREVAQLKLELT